MELLTQAEYSRRLGVTRPTICKWAKRKLIVIRGDMVDVAASDARLKCYRAGGLPPIVSDNPFVKRGRPPAIQTVTA